MLRPRKHMDLDSCPLRVSAILLNYLKAKRVAAYAELFHIVPEAALGDREITFRASVSLLFLLGKIDYLAKSDLFEFTERPATNDPL